MFLFDQLLLSPNMKAYEGLRPQDLRKLKDMLIVETADMLQAPLFTAEALLRAHGNQLVAIKRYSCYTNLSFLFFSALCNCPKSYFIIFNIIGS